jgi:hypothetical protein
MLKRADWRVLRETAQDASDSVQLCLDLAIATPRSRMRAMPDIPNIAISAIKQTRRRCS